MSDSKTRALQISAAVCTFISLLLLLLSLGTNYWVQRENRHGGLWTVCIDDVCAAFGMNVSASDHVTRAFLIIGMIAGAVSFFSICATFLQTHMASISLAKISVMTSFAAGLFAMIAMSTFTRASLGIPIYYGWSFIVGWVAFPLFLIAGGLANLVQANIPA